MTEPWLKRCAIGICLSLATTLPLVGCSGAAPPSSNSHDVRRQFVKIPDLGVTLAAARLKLMQGQESSLTREEQLAVSTLPLEWLQRLDAGGTISDAEQREITANVNEAWRLAHAPTKMAKFSGVGEAGQIVYRFVRANWKKIASGLAQTSIFAAGVRMWGSKKRVGCQPCQCSFNDANGQMVSSSQEISATTQAAAGSACQTWCANNIPDGGTLSGATCYLPQDGESCEPVEEDDGCTEGSSDYCSCTREDWVECEVKGFDEIQEFDQEVDILEDGEEVDQPEYAVGSPEEEEVSDDFYMQDGTTCP